MDLKSKMPKLLIFGGTGALGTAIAQKFSDEGYEVIYGVRTITDGKVQFQVPLTLVQYQIYLRANYLMQ